MRPIIQLFGQILAPTARRFHQALDNPELTQTSVQREICDRLIKSEYGKTLGIHSVNDWQRVPIVDYDALEPWLNQNLNKFLSLLNPFCFTKKPLVAVEQ
ncbi:GH3 family domain-containing protein [Nostoc sp. 'Peltigera malacea cyanobiont' DB3992]|uniref:GH3 family domain-containing protein n=1 Tax=Nostoc sp. 'Peltigera malacea cyanobiont' DB3992 TaxID=1206980 RepID=UPI00211E885F|nr:GH3 auxin-responsive promoter family protein [Nostoc sp. 'Peltigera malacea cyanobiont' DB3992]